MAYMSFEDLEVWKKGCRLAVKTFQVFEDCKRFSLRDQITRSALSIPSNIAEGCERNSAGDFVRFLNIANGSAAEFRTQLYIAFELKYFNEGTFKEMLIEVKDISAMLFGLIRSIKERTK
jgi:four helix bundle protein